MIRLVRSRKLTMTGALACFSRGKSGNRPTLTPKLANRGLPLGSQAYRGAQDRLGSAHGNQMENLALSSILAGGREHQRLSDLASRNRGQLFGERSQLWGEGFGSRQQDWTEAFGGRQQDERERSALSREGLLRRFLLAQAQAYAEDHGQSACSSRNRQGQQYQTRRWALSSGYAGMKVSASTNFSRAATPRASVKTPRHVSRAFPRCSPSAVSR